MKNTAKFAILALAVGVLAGCAHMPGGISDSTTPINNRPYEELGKVSGSSSKVVLFGILPISGSNNTQDAVDNAKAKIGADALIDVTVEAYNQWWILWSNTTTKVIGKGIKFK
jgi:hypothetical protein